MNIAIENILSPTQVTAVHRVLREKEAPIFNNAPKTGSVELFLNTVLTSAKLNMHLKDVVGVNRIAAFQARVWSWSKKGLMPAIFAELHHMGGFPFSYVDGNNGYDGPLGHISPVITYDEDATLVGKPADLLEQAAEKKSKMSSVIENDAVMDLMSEFGGTFVDTENNVTFEHLGDHVRYSNGTWTSEFPVEATRHPRFQEAVDFLVAS